VISGESWNSTMGCSSILWGGGCYKQYYNNSFWVKERKAEMGKNIIDTIWLFCYTIKAQSK
jgi:hypothetical protein